MKSPDFQNNSKGNFRAKLLFRIFRPFLVNKAADEGTILAVAVMLGLLFMVLGAVAIAQGGANRTAAGIDEKAHQAKSIAEGGVSNLTAALSAPSAKPLLLLNHDPNGYLGCTGADCAKWTNATEQLEISGFNSCGGSTASSRVINLPINYSGNPTKEVNIGTGKYKLLGYRFVESSPVTNPKSGTGRLYVKGRLPDSANGANSNASSTLEVQFPVKVTSGNQGSGSAILASDIDIKQMDVSSDNIICTDPALCPVSCSTGASAPTFNQLRGSIGASSGNAVLTNSNLTASPAPNIMVGQVTIPPIPAAPSGAVAAGRVYDLGNNPSVTLPRPGDQPWTADVDGTTRPTYYYQMGSFSSAITINSPNPTTFSPPQQAQFRIYVSGNMGLNGNDGITLTNTYWGYPGATTATTLPPVGQVRIYGGFSNGNPPPGNDQDWSLGGNSCIIGFMHAPHADIGVSGGGNGHICTVPAPYAGTNIYGAAWVKTFNVIGNNSNSSVFNEQPGLMGVVSPMYGNVGFKNVSIGAVTQWIRQPDPE